MSSATLNTSKGPIAVELFDEDAPKTVENFRKLAGDGFYDGLIFHRVIPDFMKPPSGPARKVIPITPVAAAPGGGTTDAAAEVVSLYEAQKKIYPRSISGTFALWRWAMHCGWRRAADRFAPTRPAALFPPTQPTNCFAIHSP